MKATDATVEVAEDLDFSLEPCTDSLDWRPCKVSKWPDALTAEPEINFEENGDFGDDDGREQPPTSSYSACDFEWWDFPNGGQHLDLTFPAETEEDLDRNIPVFTYVDQNLTKYGLLSEDAIRLITMRTISINNM